MSSAIVKKEYFKSNGKYDEMRVQRILQAVELGAPLTETCYFAGISVETYYKWCRKYPDFADKVKEAEGKAVMSRVLRIKRAEETQWQAAAWWLERRYPESFGRRQDIYHGGIDDHPAGENQKKKKFNVMEAAQEMDSEGVLLLEKLAVRLGLIEKPATMNDHDTTVVDADFSEIDERVTVINEDQEEETNKPASRENIDRRAPLLSVVHDIIVDGDDGDDGDE